jgi:hypothetical protein
MITGKDKVQYLFPEERPPLDSTIKTVSLTNALIVFAFVTVIAMNLLFIVLWRNLPFFPLPFTNESVLFHLRGAWKLALPFFSLGSYGEHIYYWKQTDTMGLYIWRWLISGTGGTALGLGTFFITLRPTGGDIQVQGKVLFKGSDAFADLSREFTGQTGSGLVISSAKPYDPTTDAIESLPKKSIIELPESIRRTHSMVIGGTGRGKTQTIFYRLVAQLYPKIRKGERIKLLIGDTKKSDYSQHFHRKHVHIIAPQEEGSIAWDICKDLTDSLLAEAFWRGKIPANDAEPIWSNSAVTIGAGCTRLLQILTPREWSYGMLAYVLGLPGDQLKPLLEEHYPEAKQVLNASGDTLTSVMFNLGAYSTDIIALGRIHDGYDTKTAVHQATAKSLRREAFIQFIYTEMLKAGLKVSVENKAIATRSIMFKGVCRYLTDQVGEWTWKHFAVFVQSSKQTQVQRAKFYFEDDDERAVVDKLLYHDLWLKLAQEIVYHAEHWDKLESIKKLSIRDWILDFNPKKKILILKPSEAYPTLTEGLIRGIFYFANSIILGELTNDNDRKFHILIDEFQSYGNMESFVAPAIEQYRSKGVSLTLAFQDLAQMVKIYKQEFVDFMSSSIGNTIIAGVSDGTTANKLTELLGNKKIQRTHRHKNSDGGFNEDIQEHEEKVVYPNEWNMLGAKNGKILYLNTFFGLNGAYVMEAPIINYKVRNMPKKASWIGAKPQEIILPDLERTWKIGVSATPTLPPLQNLHHIEDAVDDMFGKFDKQ